MFSGPLVNIIWTIIRLRMKDSLQIYEVAASALNEPPRTADTGWSSSLGVE